MKFILLFAILLSFSFSSFAKTQYDYKKYWKQENLKSKTVSMTVFTKNSPIKNVEGIATLTVSKDNTDSSESILTLLKKSLGPKKWTTDKLDGLDIYEKFDTSSMTLFRLAYNQKTKQFSIGSVKTRYMIPSYVELHLLQVENLTSQKSQTTSSFLYNLVFSKAIANDLANRAADYISGIGQNILAPTNTSLDNASARVSSSIDGAGDKIDSAADKVVNVASKKNIATLSVVASLSSAVTSSLYTFIASGTYKMARTMYYEAISEFTPEAKQQKIESFEAAMKNFAEVSPQIEKLEQKLSLLAVNMNVLNNKPTEETLALLEADINAKKRTLTEGSAACTQCLEEEILLKVKELDDMKEVIKLSGVDVAKKKGEVCNQIDDTYQAWTDAEAKLSISRRYIVQDARVYMGLVNANSKVDLASQENTKQTNACADQVKNDLSQISYADTAACDQNPQSSSAVCRNLRAFRRNLENCQVASEAQVTEDLKASLAESAANLNSKIANLAAQLSKLDCDERSKNGTCVQPGTFSKISASFTNQFTGFAAQCPDRLFSKSLPQPNAQKEVLAQVATAPAKEENKSFFSRLFSGFKSNNNTTERATTNTSRFYSDY